MSGWGKELASIWTNNVPPSRPSVEELCVYTQLLRQVQKNLSNTARLLVLGSTPEFRDWGYEENLVITVVDKSKDYYKYVSREIRHKNLKETVSFQRWEEMQFTEQFDLIIGDLSIGNTNPSEFEQFLINISKALSSNGLFVGKSFFWTEEIPVLTPVEIIREYASFWHIHPYSFINHQLGLYCLDKENSSIDFGKMYLEMKNLYDGHVIDQELFSYFTNVGWNTEMKFTFFAPRQDEFINSVNKNLSFIEFIHTKDIYSSLFPIFVIKRK